MHDQADDLRRLAWHGGPRAAAPTDRPRVLVAAGGKGGVGTTTLAVNLAVAIAGQGLRVVLVDADPGGGHMPTLCCLEEGPTIGDLLAARRPLAELLQTGPAGVRLLCGARGSGGLPDCPAEAHESLLQHLIGLGDQAELVLVDVGSGRNRHARRFWRAADEVLLVTTPDLPSVMDAYDAVKTHSDGSTAPIHPLVNMTLAAADGPDVDARLRRACLRFQGIHLASLGAVSHDPQIARAARGGKPYVLRFPGRRAARQIVRIANALAERVKQPQVSGHGHPIYADTLGRPDYVKF